MFVNQRNKFRCYKMSRAYGTAKINQLFLQPTPFEQRFIRGFLTAEGNIKLHRMFCTALFKDLLAERGGRCFVENPIFLELCECIGIEDFGPFIAIITGRLTTPRNMGKRRTQATALHGFK